MFWRPCAATACLRASVRNPPGRLSTHLLVFFRALASLSFAERVCRWLAQLLFLRSCALGPCDLVAAWVQACVHFRSPTGCPRARSVLYASSFQQAFLAPAPFCKHLPPCRLSALHAPAPFCKHLPPCRLSTRLLRFLGRPFSSSALCLFCAFLCCFALAGCVLCLRCVFFLRGFASFRFFRIPSIYLTILPSSGFTPLSPAGLAWSGAGPTGD